MDPKKTETVLDPACGTAGFLISSYKHILRANTDARGNRTLTPDEKGRLAQNFRGYDISPDMVRLSLVNMYLHGFANPHIFEYDTLTSQDRWNEYADVILANPPFMSPKGGIKPHTRFSVQSKRSEVLFVDYMAEHLTPTGRAGIIVPEGIIFQSQTAYRDLRKMLVDTALVAVVSLPAGVFQPYSGVKTSILILDKALAKRADAIAFFKVENDGFGLGAQRREIDRNDLPEAASVLKQWLANPQSTIENPKCLIVPKEKIAANGDYNLSGERYREGAGSVSAWPLVSVGSVFCKSEESVLPETLRRAVTYIGLENLTQNTGEITGDVITENPSEIKSLKNVFNPGDLLYGKLRPNLNKVWVADRKGICSTDIFVIRPIEGQAIPALYGYIFRSERFNDAVLVQLKGAQLPRIGWSSFAELQIPLPPLDVQQEIVAEIEGYQKVINGARVVLDNYRPHIPIHPDWPMVALGDASKVIIGYGFSSKDFSKANPIRAIKIANVGVQEFVETDESNLPAEFCDVYPDFVVHSGDMVIALTRSIVSTGLKVAIVPPAYHRSLLNQRVASIQGLQDLSVTKFIYVLLCADSVYRYVSEKARSLMQPNLSVIDLKQLKIPLPPLATQQAIVAEIEAEQALVAANRELIACFERKIQAALARVWGEDAPARGEERV